ncbi:MAG: hypothetical protein H0U52_16685 [Chloroflexi bacterium]|nr:hypothetical protein [Chloroflexota bacterium]
MDRLRGAGVLWAIAALIAIVTTLVFRVDPTQIIVTLVAGAIAVAVGLRLVFGATGKAIQMSTVLGVAWVALFVALAVIQSDELAAWSTDVCIAVFGAVAAVLSSRSSGASSSGIRRT